jgi:hypothetical protein
VAFENEVHDCVRQYAAAAVDVRHASLPKLLCDGIYVPQKQIVFHLIPVPCPTPQVMVSGYFQEKSLEYASLGIQIIHLWHDQWINKQEIIRSRIAALLGGGTRIHARKTSVGRIDRVNMQHFLDQNHLQGSVKSRYAYGLYAGSRLVAVASFSSGRTFKRPEGAYRSFELLRYASLLSHRIVGGMGKLTAHFIHEHNPDDIMTYADLDWASGKGYETLHFRRVAVTPPQMFWISPDGCNRYYPHRLPEQLLYDFRQQKDMAELDDFLICRGYARVYNAGNFKYLLLRDGMKP